MPTYRVHSMGGDDLGLIEHPAPNVERGDVVELPSGHDAIVTARVDTGEELIAALLKVAVAPSTPGGSRPWSRRDAESGH